MMLLRPGRVVQLSHRNARLPGKKHQYRHFGGLCACDGSFLRGSWKQFKAYKCISGVIHDVLGVSVLLMFQVTSSNVSEDRVAVTETNQEEPFELSQKD